jgi:glycosyltransferase involved in cell wall biosynthesis
VKVGLFLLYPIHSGAGTEKYFAQLARALSDAGHEVVVCGSSAQYEAARSILAAGRGIARGQGLNIAGANRKRREIGTARVLPIGPLALIAGTRAHSRLRRELQSCDVVYCKNEWQDLMTLRWVIGADGISKVVIGVHTSLEVDRETRGGIWGRIRDRLYSGRFYRRQVEACGAVHTCNRADELSIRGEYGHAAGDKTTTVPLWLDDEVTEKRSRAASDGRPLGILFAQRLTHQKGLDYFAGLIENLSATDAWPRLRFTIAGSGDYDRLARDLVERFPDNVSYRGFVGGIEDLYDSHDIVVVPSRWETFSYVTLEAQGAGLPVLASDIPGPNGVVLDGETGWLVPLGDIEAMTSVLVDAVKRRESDPDFLTRLGEAARLSVRARFGREKVVAQTLRLLASAANGERLATSTE